MSLSSLLLLSSGQFIAAAGTATIDVSTTGDAHIFEILPAAGTATIYVSATGDPMVTIAAAGSALLDVSTTGTMETVGPRLMAKCYVSQIPESAGDNVYAPVSHITMRLHNKIICCTSSKNLCLYFEAHRISSLHS